MYWILNECVDEFHYFNFLNLALERVGPYRAIQDNNDPCWTTWHHSGPYQAMVFPIEHYGPCRTVQDNKELKGTNKYKKQAGAELCQAQSCLS